METVLGKIDENFEKITTLGYSIDKSGFGRRFYDWGSRADEVPAFKLTLQNFRMIGAVIGNTNEGVSRRTRVVTFDVLQTRPGPLQAETVTKVSMVMMPNRKHAGKYAYNFDKVIVDALRNSIKWGH